MNKYKVAFGLIGVVIVLAMVFMAVQSIQAGSDYRRMVIKCKNGVLITESVRNDTVRIEGVCTIIRVSEVNPYPGPGTRPTVEPMPYPEPPAGR